MAGSHNSGFKYSRSNLFQGAPMVLVPERFDDILAWLEEQRPRIKAEIPDEKVRSVRFAALFSACLERGRPLTDAELEERL